MDSAKWVERQEGDVGSVPELTTPETEALTVCKRKLEVLLYLEQYEQVVTTGYCFIGSEGPNIQIQKYIVSALCKDGQYKACLDVLNKWERIYPGNFKEIQEIKKLVEPLIQHVLFNNSPAFLFQKIDELLGLWKLEPRIKNPQNVLHVKSEIWKYRPPPVNSSTYFLCPRLSDSFTCIFGEKCLAAHSKEELEEWKVRVKTQSSRMNSETNYVGLSSQHQLPLMPRAVRNRNHIEGRGPRLCGVPPGSYAIWLPIPPPNTPYLNHLIKEYSEHSPLNDFWTKIEGIKLIWSSPLKISSIGFQHVWTVLIRSERRETLRTVSLLQDMDRINFRISEAYFCEDSNYKQSINLIESNVCNHKNSAKLQVLSTFIPSKCLNRPCYYYRMSFTFMTISPGEFSQTIVFDFKEKPKLVQHLSVHVLNAREVDLLQERRAFMSPSSPKSAQFELNTHETHSYGPNSTRSDTSSTLDERFGSCSCDRSNSSTNTSNIIPLSSPINNVPHFGTCTYAQSDLSINIFNGNGPLFPNPVDMRMRPKDARSTSRLYEYMAPRAESTKLNKSLHHSDENGTRHTPHQFEMNKTNGRQEGRMTPLARQSRFSLLEMDSDTDVDSPVSFEEDIERRAKLSPIARPNPEKIALRERKTEVKTEVSPPGFPDSNGRHVWTHLHPGGDSCLHPAHKIMNGHHNLRSSQTYNELHPSMNFLIPMTPQGYWAREGGFQSRHFLNENNNLGHGIPTPGPRHFHSFPNCYCFAFHPNLGSKIPTNGELRQPQKSTCQFKLDNAPHYFRFDFTENNSQGLKGNSGQNYVNESVEEMNQGQDTHSGNRTSPDSASNKLNTTPENPKLRHPAPQEEKENKLLLNKREFPPLQTPSVEAPTTAQENDSDWMKVTSKRGSRGKRGQDGNDTRTLKGQNQVRSLTTSIPQQQLEKNGTGRKNEVSIAEIRDSAEAQDLFHMGFPEDQVLRALQRANSNRYEAIEILLEWEEGQKEL